MSGVVWACRKLRDNAEWHGQGIGSLRYWEKVDAPEVYKELRHTGKHVPIKQTCAEWIENVIESSSEEIRF